MLRRLTIISAFLCPVFALLLFLVFAQWMDAKSRIESAVLYEMLLVGDREFLMYLPSAVDGSRSRDEAVKLLSAKFPNSVIESYKSGIVWGGNLFVDLDPQNRVLLIRELDKVERQSLVDRAYEDRPE